MKDYPQRKLDCSNNELELFTRTTFARAKVFSSKEMEKEFFLSNWPLCCDQSTYFYNNMIYGMHEFISQRLIKTRFQMNKIRLGKIVLQDNQYPFRIEHTFHSNHTPCLSHYASNASHSCTQHNS